MFMEWAESSSKRWHFLIVRFSSLGDLILASSFWESLKERWGDRIRVSVLTSSEYEELFKHHLFIDDLWIFDRRKQKLKDLGPILKQIQQEQKVDLIVDMHGSLRSLFVRLFLWSVPRIFMDKRTLERSILTWFKLDFLSKSKSKNGSRLGELLLIRNVADFSDLFDMEPHQGEKGRRSSCSLTYNNEKKLEPLLSQYELEKQKYICIVPSASYPEKRWPPEYFSGLITKCLEDAHFSDYKFVILAGPADDFCKQFDSINSDGRLINLQGKTSLLESTHILKNSKFCVGNDTGLPHIAESLSVPSLFILGPTGEEFGFFPHLPNSQVVSKNLWCRPCTTNGKGFCIRSERFCLTKITVEEVFETLIKMDTK